MNEQTPLVEGESIDTLEGRKFRVGTTISIQDPHDGTRDTKLVYEGEDDGWVLYYFGQPPSGHGVDTTTKWNMVLKNVSMDEMFTDLRRGRHHVVTP